MSGPEKTAVITGGAGGLGRALAAALAAEGWFPVVLDLAGPALDNAGAGLGDAGLALTCDVTDDGSVEKACAEILRQRPSVDLVIYNAGVTQIRNFAGSSLDDQRRVMEINHFGAVRIAKQMLEPLRASRGVHLAISSVAGFTPLMRRTAYAASKHALEGFFTSLAAEEAEHGVAVLIAAPSFIATNPGDAAAAGGGIGRPGAARDGVDEMTAVQAAAIILDGVKRRRAFIPVGRVARMAWWINRLSPGLYMRIMRRRMAEGAEN